jgi:hypothetical protein
MDPNLTPSGINVNAALGYISYLVLLVLLQASQNLHILTFYARAVTPLPYPHLQKKNET